MKTPASSKLLYFLAVIFLIVSLYMLYAAVIYTKLYLATYEAEFVDLWQNAVKYVIEHFVPYFAFSVISFGLGRAISASAKGKEKTEEEEAAAAKGVKVRAEDLDELKDHELDVASELEKEYQKRLDESRMMLATEMATYDMRRADTEKTIMSRLEELESVLLAKASAPVLAEEPEEEPEVIEEPVEEIVEEPAEEPAEEIEEEPAEEVEEEAEEEPAEETEEEPAEEVEEEPVEEVEEEEAEEEPAEEPVEEEPVEEAEEEPEA